MTTRASLGSIGKVFIGVFIGLVLGFAINQVVRLDAVLVLTGNACSDRIDKFSFDPPVCPDGMDDEGDWCYPNVDTPCLCSGGVVSACNGEGVCGCEEFFCCNSENKCVSR